MSAGLSQQPPFLPGQYMAATVSGATTEAQLIGQEWEGKEFWFLDYDWSSSNNVKPLRTNIAVKRRIVRNVSGVSLKGSRLVVLGPDGTANSNATTYGASSSYTAIQPTSGKYLFTRIGGTCRLPTLNGFPLDEFLPSGGVPHGALCYIVVEGPAVVLTDGADINAGDFLGGVATITTAAATDNSGGKLTTGISFASTDMAMYSGIYNVLGRAISTGVTTADAGVLVNVKKVFPF